VLAGTAEAHLVSTVADPTGARLSLYDLGGVPGTGPLTLAYNTNASPPEVQDATTGTWRRLPPGNRNSGIVDATPLTATEATGGLVRVRWTGFGDTGFQLGQRHP